MNSAAIPIHGVQRRDLTVVALLSTLTLGLYCVYLLYQWTRELNQLAGRERRSPATVLLLCILTLGVGGMVFECLYAYEAAEYSGRNRPKEPPSSLPMWVLVCNSLGVVCSLTVVGAPLAVILGIAATVLVQAELNRLAGE